MTVDLTLGDTEIIIEEAKRHGLLRNELAYVLATAKWETAHTMKPVREAYWLSEDWRARNLRYYPWYGRGYVQLTWEANYRRASIELGVNLMDDPDEAMQPDVSASVLVMGMQRGWFTGKKLGDYISLSRSDFVGARRIVNGTDKAREIAAIAREYDEALKRAGYGEEPAPTMPDPEATAGALASLFEALADFFGGLFRKV